MLLYSINEASKVEEQFHEWLKKITGGLKTAEMSEADIEKRLKNAKEALANSEAAYKKWKGSKDVKSALQFSFGDAQYRKYFWWAIGSAGALGAVMGAVSALVGMPTLAPAAGLAAAMTSLEIFGYGGDDSFKKIIANNKLAVEYLEERKKKLKSAKNESTCYNYRNVVELI